MNMRELEEHYLISPVLIAGGNWNNGVSCGSRARNGNNARSNANTNIGGRRRIRRLNGEANSTAG